MTAKRAGRPSAARPRGPGAVAPAAPPAPRLCSAVSIAGVASVTRNTSCSRPCLSARMPSGSNRLWKLASM